jgi:uncharacterized membrane protein YgcG
VHKNVHYSNLGRGVGTVPEKSGGGVGGQPPSQNPDHDHFPSFFMAGNHRCICMHRATPFLVRHPVLMILAFLLCTGPAGAALSDHPVITGISGPGYIAFDENGAATGSYTYTATVTCGSPPYTYKWMNPAGFKTLYEGQGLSTVTIPVSKLALSGGNRWAVWLTVTDSAGHDALWMRTNGAGNTNEFLYYLETDYAQKSWKKITEPATFPPAPSSCPQASGSTGSSTGGGNNGGSGTGGGGSNGGGGDLPLVPIAAAAAIVAAAALAGAKVLGGKAAAGEGPAVPDTPATTRTWTDHRGMERTATLQPDGTWISDSGSTVDLEKTADAQRNYQDDLRHSAAQREAQAAADAAKADADRKELESVRAAGDKAVGDAQKDLRDYRQWKQDQDQGYADMYKKHADGFDNLVNKGEMVVTGADFGVNVLEKATGPLGKMVKTGYTIGKDLGKNMSGSYQKGESLWKGAAKGGLEAGFDLGFDKLKKALPSGPGNWDFKGSTTDLGKGLADGVKSAVQSQVVKTVIKDPIKDLAKKGSDAVLGSSIGKFK